MGMPATVSSAPSILRVGTDPDFVGTISEAARLAFPGTTVSACPTVDDALKVPADGVELIALCEPTAESVAKACAALDASRLPRWAVVVFAAAVNNIAGDSCTTVAREEWNVPQVARALRAAIGRRCLRRENTRLRGDLTTLGFRIAHDLRTPLGGVVTTTEMLKEILAEDAPDKAPLTQPILDSAEGLVRLIERVSFVTKATASVEPPARFSMMTPFWNAFQTLEAQIIRSGATLIEPKDWPMVRGHSNWLEVVWRNLLANAVEHGGRGMRIRAGWTAAGDENRFWVQDNGSVLPEKRATLFFPFHRLHESAAPRGLGLSMVQRLVELDGGKCGFEPLPEGGSVFFFTLPADAGA